MDQLKKNDFSWRRFIGNYAILMALAILIVIITVNRPQFLSGQNIINILRQASVTGLIAIGMTFVVLTGGIDLSVGYIFAAAGMAAALTAQNHDLPAILPVLAGLGVGFAMGALNGVVVAYLKVPAFIATLGVQSFARGIALYVTDAKPVPGLSDQFLQIGKGDVLGIPIPAFIMLAVLVISFILLYNCKYGRHVYAVGGSRSAAIISGVKVKPVEMSTYIICGLLSGLSGAVMTARVSSGIANIGQGYETDAIAAVVMGGTSLMGGRGRLWGTIVGFMFMTIMNIGLDMMNFKTPIQLMIKGALIIAAVMLDSLAQSDK